MCKLCAVLIAALLCAAPIRAAQIVQERELVPETVTRGVTWLQDYGDVHTTAFDPFTAAPLSYLEAVTLDVDLSLAIDIDAANVTDQAREIRSLIYFISSSWMLNLPPFPGPGGFGMTAGGVCAPHAPCSFHREADVALRFTFPVASFDTFDVPRGIIAYFGFQPSEDKVSFTGTASGTAGGTARLTYDYRTVPEPGTLALLLIGALGWWVAHLPTRRRA